MRDLGRRFSALMAVTILSVAAFGCGGGGGSASYDDVLRGLRNAALSKATYNAVRHADDLEATEKAVVNAFCSIATQLADNGETLGEQEYFEAIKGQSEEELGVVASIPVNLAVTKLRAVYDLASINGGAANLYARACFR